MKTPLAVINELAQKRLINAPVCDIDVYGSEHNKTFTCKMSVNGFESITQTASSKEKAKRKAAELLLLDIQSKMDINAKPKAKIKGVSNIHELTDSDSQQGKEDKENKATNIIPFASNNPVSQLLELEQAGFIEPVEYHFNEFDIKPQRQYECICTLNKLTTKALTTSKKKAKAQAAQQLLDQILLLDEFHQKYKEVKRQEAQKFKGAVKAPVTTKAQPDDQQNKTPAALILELQQQGVITSLDFKAKAIIKDNHSAFEYICYVDDLIVSATSTNKKEAKQLAAQAMLNQLKDNGIDINAKANKDFPYLVEQNACAEWIKAICPADVEIRQISWYLTSDCVMITLGTKQTNPKESVDTFKKQIEDETKLLVLINRERDAKRAIDRLKNIADENGNITDIAQLDKVALGSYFKPRTFAEPNINWANRKDHTKDHCFTIDSDSSIDLDDAFSVTLKDDGLEVCIHIADVSELVPESSQEDHKAIKQCFTYYGASKQMPMLHNQTMYQASLLPHKDRMTWTVAMSLNNNAHVQHYTIYPSVIRSKFRLDQATITKLIDSNANQQSKAFQVMTQISEKLMQNRMKDGGVNEIAEESVGYQLVQEFMLLANRCVADFCLQKQIPIPYRVHKFSDESVNIKELYNKTTNHKALLPFLGRASYSVEANEHEALAFRAYCHFTSPIRRYADLLVQRQLRRFYQGKHVQSAGNMQDKINKINQCELNLQSSQTTIRYIERLQVQFRQCGKPVQAVVDKIEDGFCFLKGLSQKYDRYLRLAVNDMNETVNIGNTLTVTQQPCYNVINEAFSCQVEK
ncbi:MAG: RNB domain-containing ribonuclease [Proteobacteria bacterium]|nr:RNB domain-containing ribonuclease [Pseudomonadota bacterium]